MPWTRSINGGYSVKAAIYNIADTELALKNGLNGEGSKCNHAQWTLKGMELGCFLDHLGPDALRWLLDIVNDAHLP